MNPGVVLFAMAMVVLAPVWVPTIAAILAILAVMFGG